MTKKGILAGICCLILIAGMVLLGCDTGHNTYKSNDPVAVDVSLPAIHEVPSFTGAFVSSEADARKMIAEAMTAVSQVGNGITPYGSSLQFLSRTMLRSIQTASIDKVYDHDKTILSGAEVTGFIKGTAALSSADDNKPGSAVGDYQETAIKAKVAVDFGNSNQNSITIKGKCGLNINFYQKDLFIAINPTKNRITVKNDVTGGLALSLSKNGEGLKFVMRLQVNADGTYNAESINLDDLDGLFKNVNISIDIYNNENVKIWSKTFTHYKEAAAYLSNI